ncbi:MAG: 50S ribosomal protein L17 [bacterium]
MRHRLKDRKLGRNSAHRKAMVSAVVCALIEQGSIRTTLPKAKVAGSLAERMVTVARTGSAGAAEKVNAWRRAASILRRPEIVNALFTQVVPACDGRVGGYTRIIRLDRRRSDGAEMAILEWVNRPPTPKATTKAKEKTEKKD